MKINIFLHVNSCFSFQVPTSSRWLFWLLFLHHTQNFQGYSRTLLHCACEHGHLEVVKCLLRAGAYADKYALSSACEMGHLNIVEHLLGTGVKVNEYAMKCACRKRHFPIIECLIQHGATYSPKWDLSDDVHQFCQDRQPLDLKSAVQLT